MNMTFLFHVDAVVISLLCNELWKRLPFNMQVKVKGPITGWQKRAEEEKKGCMESDPRFI